MDFRYNEDTPRLVCFQPWSPSLPPLPQTCAIFELLLAVFVTLISKYFPHLHPTFHQHHSPVPESRTHFHLQFPWIRPFNLFHFRINEWKLKTGCQDERWNCRFDVSALHFQHDSSSASIQKCITSGKSQTIFKLASNQSVRWFGCCAWLTQHFEQGWELLLLPCDYRREEIKAKVFIDGRQSKSGVSAVCTLRDEIKHQTLCHDREAFHMQSSST